MTEHKIIVEESDGGSFGPKDGAGAWRPECECGWKGGWQRFDSFDDTNDPADAAHDAAAWYGQLHAKARNDPAEQEPAAPEDRQTIALERIAAELHTANQLAYLRDVQPTNRSDMIVTIRRALFENER